MNNLDVTRINIYAPYKVWSVKDWIAEQESTLQVNKQ